MSPIGDAAGTAMTSYSPVSRAIGVACASETGESFQSVAPSITRPVMSSDRGRCRLRVDELREPDRAGRARHVLHLDDPGEAPASSTCCMARAV